MSDSVNCPYCHEPITPGVTVIRCPVCATGHHKECWYSNDRRCAVYRCAGRGEGVVLGATATIGAPSIGNQTAAGSKELAMKKAQLRAIREDDKGKTIECPHCGGTTVCNLWGDGSCIYCRARNGGLDKGSIVICQRCRGSGEITLHSKFTICRHCGGTGHCQHGTGKYASCLTCINTARAESGVHWRYSAMIDEMPEEPVRCSVCKGYGARV
jgi:hypothetical protein